MITTALLLCAPFCGGGLGDQVAAAAPTERAGSGWASLSSANQGEISKAMGRDDATYWVRQLAGNPALTNVGQHFTAQFVPTGAEVASGGARWGLGLTAVGHGDRLDPVPAAVPVTEANRVDYRRGSINEWYVNGPAGLEQGFTLAQRPGGDPDQALTLALGASGSLTGVLDRGGAGVVLTHGSDSLTYRGLVAADATGRALPAHLDLRGGQVVVQVDDRGAQYPITVDPFVQNAKLIADDGAFNNQLGAPVAISGNTMVAAATSATVGTNAQQGAVYVFVAPAGPGGTLTEVAKLVASDGFTNAFFGGSVAIDGNTIVVGEHNATGTTTGQGAAYVFVQPVGGWTGNLTETAKLTASDGAHNDHLGQSVAIAGSTVVAGAFAATVNGNLVQGAGYVFTQPAGGWGSIAAQHESAKLTASDGAANDEFGDSAAISGNTIVMDAPQVTVNGNIDAGAMYVFVAPTGGWAGTVHEAAKLTATDSGTVVRLGRSGSLVVSGNTVVAGAHQAQIGTHQSQGAAYVFAAPPGGWAGAQTESAKLIASDGTDSDQLGNSVGISGDTVVAGAPGADIGTNFDQGAIYVFAQPAGGWTGAAATPQHETAKLLAADGALGDQLGEAVAISETTMVAGANAATVGGNIRQGATYAFQAAPTATTITLGVSPSSPAPAAPGETLTATITPVAAGTVEFLDGSTPLGAPLSVAGGAASLTTTLPPGAHSLSAVFTPTDQTPITGFTGSTSALVAYSVDAKRPLCIRICR